MIALDTEITLPVVREAAGRAWNWWTKELLNALPSRIRARISPSRTEFTIHFGTANAIVSGFADQGAVPLATIGLAGDKAEGDIANARHFFPASGSSRVTVLLANALVLRRELDLPKTAEPKLKQIVGLDLDRQTPLTTENAAFDAFVRERNAETGRIRVALGVAKLETIERVLKLCARLGNVPDVVAIGDPGSVEGEFNLLPSKPRGQTHIRRLWKQPRFLVGAGFAILLAFNIGLSFARLDRRLDLLTAELVKARKEAQSTEKLRAQLAQSQSQQQLRAELRNQPQPLAILQELTHLFPDDVWLFELQISNGVGQMAGYSPSASSLIEKLDKSEHFTNPKLKSSIARPDKPGEERFEIGFDLRGVGAK